MHRQQLRTLPLVLFPLIVATLGCVEEEEPVADETSDTGDQQGDPRPEGPTVEIMVDGGLPPTLQSADVLQLLAEVEGPAGIDAVEFYLDDQLISVDEHAPYTASVLISDSSFNGQRSLIARAYDSNGNMGEGAVELSVELPGSGTVEWEYIGAGDGQRWVLVGSEDAAMVFDRSSMQRISAEGALLSSYEFTYEVTAVTQDSHGPIAVGMLDDALVIQRFANDGLPMYLDLMEDFDEPGTTITDAAVGKDGRLVISSFGPGFIDPSVDTTRISGITYGNDKAATFEWSNYLRRATRSTDPEGPSRVAVTSSGEIYTTARFDFSDSTVHLQLLGLTPNGALDTFFEYLVNERARFNDVVPVGPYAFVAARLNDLAAIERFDSEGVPDAIFYIDAAEALVLEPNGDDLIYAAQMPDGSPKLGRISAYGAERWSKQLGGNDVVHDIAVTSCGNMYVVSGWDEAKWRLRRVHP